MIFFFYKRYFTLPICFYPSQDTSRSLSPWRRPDNPHSSRTWDKIFEGYAEDYYRMIGWKMVTVLSTVMSQMGVSTPDHPPLRLVIMSFSAIPPVLYAQITRRFVSKKQCELVPWLISYLQTSNCVNLVTSTLQLPLPILVSTRLSGQDCRKKEEEQPKAQLTHHFCKEVNFKDNDKNNSENNVNKNKLNLEEHINKTVMATRSWISPMTIC